MKRVFLVLSTLAVIQLALPSNGYAQQPLLAKDAAISVPGGFGLVKFIFGRYRWSIRTGTRYIRDEQTLVNLAREMANFVTAKTGHKCYGIRQIHILRFTPYEHSGKWSSLNIDCIGQKSYPTTYKISCKQKLDCKPHEWIIR